jgi:hypothetical protein
MSAAPYTLFYQITASRTDTRWPCAEHRVGRVTLIKVSPDPPTTLHHRIKTHILFSVVTRTANLRGLTHIYRQLLIYHYVSMSSRMRVDYGRGGHFRRSIRPSSSRAYIISLGDKNKAGTDIFPLYNSAFYT